MGKHGSRSNISYYSIYFPHIIRIYLTFDIKRTKKKEKENCYKFTPYSKTTLLLYYTLAFSTAYN